MRNFMKINLNPYNANFTGKKPPTVDDLKKVADIVDANLGGVVSKLTSKIQECAPDMLEDSDGRLLLKNSKHFAHLAESAKAPFTTIPKRILDNLAKSAHKVFPDNKFFNGINNSKFLTKFRQEQEVKLYERAVRGIYEYGCEFLDDVAKEKSAANGAKAYSTCKEVTKKFFGKFDEQFSINSSKYNTREERGGVRLISAAIAAAALGQDFFNKAKRDGASDDEANGEAKVKIKQEMLAGVGEAYSQFAILGGFPKFINNSQFGAPVISAGLGVLFNITSRLQTNRPLVRIKPPVKMLGNSPVDIKDFIKSLDKKNGVNKIDALKNKKPDKKPLLSLKNILLGSVATVVAGLTLKYGNKAFLKTSLGENFNNLVKKAGDKFRKATVEKLYVSDSEMDVFFDALKKTGNEKSRVYYGQILKKIAKDSETGKVYIGEYEKTIKCMGVELSKAELLRTLTSPIRLVKEIASYPYKGVCKILEQAGVKDFVESAPKKLDNPHNAVNIFRDFQKQKAKFKGSEEEFIEFYKGHLSKNALQAMDKTGNSKISNGKVGKLTQLLGTVTSLYFATTDDYNRTITRTGNQKKAEKDARQRGITKAFRIVSQIILIDMFNGVFKVSYAKSLLGALGISAACTVATENLSRFLSGMPNKKMNAKELQEFEENKKKGISGGYYKLIDKLSD